MGINQITPFNDWTFTGNVQSFLGPGESNATKYLSFFKVDHLEVSGYYLDLSPDLFVVLLEYAESMLWIPNG